MEIRKRILELYAQSDRRLGVKKMTLCLAQVYRLMKQMKLPKISTVKLPKATVSKEDPGVCQNLLSQKFDQKFPNLVWVSDFTYVNVGGKFHYVCASLDLYARKVIVCRIGCKIDRFLAIDTLRDAVSLRGVSRDVSLPPRISAR